MSNRDRFTPDEEEPPLDPAAERIRQKLARLLLGSLGVMLLGLIAVFGAILYRVGFAQHNSGDGSRGVSQVTTRTVEGRIPAPAGSELMSASLDGNRALLHVRQPTGARWLIVVDVATGQILARFEIVAE